MFVILKFIALNEIFVVNGYNIFVKASNIPLSNYLLDFEEQVNK